MGPSAIAGRRHRLRERLAASDPGVDSLLVSSRANVRYLSGFSGSNGWLLLARGRDPVLLTDGRYREQAAVEAPGCRTVVCATGLADGVAANVPSGSRAGFEADHLSYAAAVELQRTCAAARWQATSGLVEGLRAVKSAPEVDAIRAALQLAETVLTEVVSGVTAGITEAELAAEIDRACRLRGARRMAFDTIVAAGPHGALPHATPGAAPIPAGVPVVVDMGCELDGYCSDITRCAVLGGELDEQWRRVHGAVSRARAAGIDAIRPGVAAREVDRAARAALAADGLADAFVHGLGHGVGIEVHEAPRLSARSDDVLAAGMVVTVEPGVYLEGRGGVRLEDLIVVREAGAERLNELDDEPLRGRSDG